VAREQKRARYPADLTDEQWELVQPALWRTGKWGRPTEVDLREVVDAILYLVRTECQGRRLPREFPHFSSVRYDLDKWQHDGTWEEWNAHLRRQARGQAGRQAEPRAGLLDSQSVKTTEARGYDGGKKDQGAQAASAGRHAGVPPRRARAHG
jgi:putative transposase